MSVEFDTPANRIIQQLQPKNQFRIDTSLPDLAFLRQLSIQGRLRQQNAFKSASSAATLITLTPATGETLFIYSMFLASTLLSVWTVTNKNDVKTFRTLGVTGSSNNYNAPFFDSIVGDGTSTFTIAIDAAAGVRTATILFWTENTARIRDAST